MNVGMPSIGFEMGPPPPPPPGGIIRRNHHHHQGPFGPGGPGTMGPGLGIRNGGGMDRHHHHLSMHGDGPGSMVGPGRNMKPGPGSSRNGGMDQPPVRIGGGERPSSWEMRCRLPPPLPRRNNSNKNNNINSNNRSNQQWPHPRQYQEDGDSYSSNGTPPGGRPSKGMLCHPPTPYGNNGNNNNNNRSNQWRPHPRQYQEDSDSCYSGGTPPGGPPRGACHPPTPYGNNSNKNRSKQQRPPRQYQEDSDSCYSGGTPPGRENYYHGRDRYQEEEYPCTKSPICQILVYLWDDDVNIVKNAFRVLANICFGNENEIDNRQEVASLGGPIAIIMTMDKHSSDIDLLGAGCKVIQNLSTDERLDSLLVEVGCVEAVVKAMRGSVQHAGLQSHGCGTLRNLASTTEHRAQIEAAGGIRAIIQAMKTHRDNARIQFLGCYALCNLAIDDDGEDGGNNTARAVLAAGGLSASARAAQNHKNHIPVLEASSDLERILMRATSQ